MDQVGYMSAAVRISLTRYRLRGLVLIVLLVLAIALVPAVVAPATSHVVGTHPSRAELTHPQIMSAAADQAASSSAALTYAAAMASGPHPATVPLALGISSRPRKEVLGFVNAGNLGSSTVGYPSWNLGLLTTVAFFGLSVNSGDGAIVKSGTGWNVWTSQTLVNFVNTAHANGVKVIVSIDLHDLSTNPTGPMCQGLTTTNSGHTINEAITQMNAARVDGINVDYEGAIATCADGNSNRDDFTSFVQRLRAAMPSGSFLVVDSYGGSAEDNLEFFNVTGLSPYIDAFFVMAYDMDGSNFDQPPLNCPSYCMSPVSPLNTYRFNVSKTIAQYTALVPPSQVILGQPYYGRRGCVANLADAHQLTTTPASPTYKFASTIAGQSGVSQFSAHRDPSDGISEWDTWYDSDFACNREQYFDDVYSLGAKYDLVNSSGIRGVGLFALDYAGLSPELWNSLAAHFTCPGTNFITGDFNGDGKTDVAVIGSQSVCVMASTGTAFSIPVPWASIPFYGTKATLAGDVTGDGKADLVAVNGGQTFVLPSTGTAFGPPQGWATVPFYGTRGTFLVDVNGDGKADLVAINDNTVFVMLSTGTSFAAPALWSNTPFYGTVGTTSGDVSGDGKADLVAVNSGSTFVMTSTGTSFAAPAEWSNQPFYGTVTTTIGDASGDGKADLIALNSGNAFVMTSTGTGFAAPVRWSGAAFYGQLAILRGDVTGDGTVDMIAVNNLSVWVEASTGTGFAAPAMWLSGPP
ncbi:MAG: FG-GAP-like repeat-containing protein [Candidatus Dormiibacterota bacterium]